MKLYLKNTQQGELITDKETPILIYNDGYGLLEGRRQKIEVKAYIKEILEPGKRFIDLKLKKKLFTS